MEVAKEMQFDTKVS